MGFRDALAAATSRAAALERELGELRAQRDALAAKVRALEEELSTAYGRLSLRRRRATRSRQGRYCAACGVLNRLSLSRCSQCGAQLPARGGGDAGPEHCPGCRVGTLQHLDLGQVGAQGCARCGGAWLETAALCQAVAGARHGTLNFDPKVLDLFWDGQHSAPLSTHLECPICRQRMARRSHAASQVVVDRCLDHGVWLDRGEFSRILGWEAEPRAKASRAAGDAKGELGARGLLEWLGDLLALP